MSGYTYYVFHLIQSAQERLGLPEEVAVWNYLYDEEASKLDGRLWYKASIDNEKNIYLLIRHDEIKTLEERVFTPEPTYETTYGLSDSNYNSSSCFIATACSANLNELSSLYHFRDKYLVNFSLGRKFIDFYYTFSPSIADLIRSSTFLKLFTRYFFIKPIVFLLDLFLISKRI
jgi:hypothetical protein